MEEITLLFFLYEPVTLNLRMKKRIFVILNIRLGMKYTSEMLRKHTLNKKLFVDPYLIIVSATIIDILSWVNSFLSAISNPSRIFLDVVKHICIETGIVLVNGQLDKKLSVHLIKLYFFELLIWPTSKRHYKPR